eukprot:767900-Hanusia_phi.AAC.1
MMLLPSEDIEDVDHAIETAGMAPSHLRSLSASLLLTSTSSPLRAARSAQVPTLGAGGRSRRTCAVALGPP